MGKPPVYVNCGDRFGSLVVIREKPPRVTKWGFRRMVECRCDCGTVKAILLDSLRRGGTVSCGCHKIRIAVHRLTTHGLSSDSAYGCWQNMITRCSRVSEKNYCGRGISVCPQWRFFAVFLNDMGPRPSAKHSIDRFPDNDGNYEPGNCRWATRIEQARNTRIIKLVTFAGETKCVADWAESTGLSRPTIRYRLNAGWPVELALTLPNTRVGMRIEFSRRLKSAVERMKGTK